ncbi:DNA polymerase III subunit delta' [Altererythrobacter sp. MF3-039]|uniref:DNA polymerase III subunit delta' n=1 Tax=Altererythrobacter sp. MF3-039 TaxID=3252901 RepID=UPI00390CA207
MLIGHEEPWREWRDAREGSRMHHGWIFAGRRGLGKMQFALKAARDLVTQPGIPQPENDHPDIIVLTHLPKDDKEEKKRQDGKPYEVKRNIAISQIRTMQQRLNTRPTLGDRRAIIIDPADDLETGAANALLKSLEEPPQGTFFLLVAHRPAQLLPTIRSRCRMLRFPTLTDADMARLLADLAPHVDENGRQAALAAANGSPGMALDFVERELGAIDRLMREIVSGGDRDFSLRGKLAEAIGNRPDRARMQAILDLARSVLAREIEDPQIEHIPAIVDGHSRLVTLAGQAPTYNFDPGLLIMEIGGLLASAAPPRERANV